MGTPDFSVPCLEQLINSRHEVIAVVTQPDRPRNRGVVSACPVKVCAEKHGLKVLQYEKVSREGIDDIRALNPDVIVTAAFGQMLSRDFLLVAPHGVINVHASLLPKYRGSSPIQWAVINGEKETGVTAYKMDSGDIILQKRVAVGVDETAGELFEKLSALGAPALIEALDLIESGKATFTPQNEDEMTYFPMLKKEDGEIDFSMSATDIKHRIQGLTPWPSAYTTCGGKKMKIIKATVENMQGSPKQVLKADKDAKDYLLGHRIAVGEEL